MLETLDIILRNASTGIFLMLAVLIMRDYGWRLAAVLGALSSLTAASYTICTQSWFDWHSANFFWIVGPFCVLGPIHIWLFSLSQFQDDFRLKPYHGGVLLLYIVLNQVNFGGTEPTYFVGIDVTSVAYAALRFLLIVHMVYVAWQGRADDLLEARRRFRGTYIVLVSLTIFVIFVLETLFTFEQLSHPYISFSQAAAFFALAIVIFLRVTGTREGLLLVGEIQEVPLQRAQAKEELDPADEHDLAEIRRVVVEERKFLESGLTINGLAARIGLPEHRLRRLINRHLGYRNFADFLNHYRIQEAQRLLADPANRHTQVLSIAMDLGYGSLGPFNRAFKARTHRTPTEYRRAALAYSEQ